MKVAIVTQALGLNIGGILQNLALQRVLASMGHTPVTIDYRPDRRLSARDYARIAVRNARTAVLRAAGRYDRMLRMCDYRPTAANMKFVSDHISLTPPCESYREAEGAEAYIVGSDQVWRPRYNPGVLADSFLRFVSDPGAIRLSYAASFGVDTWEYTPEQEEECRRLAARFHAVSVRELSGITLCRDHLGCDARLVADPTLLLDAADYRTLCAHIPAYPKPFNAAYILDLRTDKHRMCAHMGRATGLPTVQMHPRATAPDRWLARIRDSRHVITDSFHGTVFAIIFRKPFVVLANSRRGNARLESLLGGFGLADRIASSTADIDRILASAPDWEKAAAAISQMRAESFEFLRNALNTTV